MSNKTYAYFKVINHTNTLSVSSYALPFCIYRFVLDLDGVEKNGILSNKQILWDYGDGTTETTLTGAHAYSTPGTYQVTCYLYDGLGNAYLNTYARNVIVSNYITDTISLSTSSTTSYNLTAGRIVNPIIVKRANSYQTYSDDMQYTIIPYASGSNMSLSYFDNASSLLYGHLEKNHSFYIEQDTPAGTVELVESNEITTSQTKIYCKLVNNEVIHTTENDINGFFCGTSGQETVYFKDDRSYADTTRTFQVLLTSTYPFSFPFIQIRSPLDIEVGETYYTSISSGVITLETAPIPPIGPGTYYVWKLELAPGEVDSIPYPSIALSSRILSAAGMPPWEADWSNNTPPPEFVVDDYYIAPINLLFGFKTDIFNINTSTIGLSSLIYPNTHFNELSITSNGIDGEGSQLSTFDINTNKFIGQKINFVIKVKDYDWFTIKDINFINYTNILSSYNGELSSTFVVQSSANGYLKGYVIPHTAADNAFIYATSNISYLDSGSYMLTGASTQFNILDTVINIAKKGEDIDMLDKYKSLRFQELFLDNINLFDNFLGSIVGDLSSNQNSIGKKVYEKITNFVDNNSNIEKCELAQLISILQSIEEQNITFEKINFNYPTGLKRLIDILSIKHSKLFGSRNTFDLDFYNYGNQLGGNNLGTRIIDTLNYTITAGNHLVALEKYSGTFKKLDTYTPLSSASLSGLYASQYPLSAYNDDWGWHLVLNNEFQPTDITKYYIFFNHQSYLNPVEDSVINFEDNNTTITHSASSYDEWKRDNGTIDNLINYELAVGLGLISPLSP